MLLLEQKNNITDGNALSPAIHFFSNLYQCVLNKAISATFLVENAVFLGYS
jgi:hypothetical protein